uniref:RRM domain-containing protein n=1 Tax=Setaria digitata TaxID=48799 RepID=A0A915PN09_9BILA
MLQCFFAQSSNRRNDNDNNSDNDDNNNDNVDGNLFQRQKADFTAISAGTNDSATITVLTATTLGSRVDTIRRVPVLDLDEDGTDRSIGDLIMTLEHTQAISDIATAIESSLSTIVTSVSGFFSHRSISAVSVFSSDDDDNDSGDENDADNEGDEEPIPSTSRNYLSEWTPQYNSSLSIFATLSSGNFLSENEITQIFSQYGSIKEVKWIQISDSNGYIIVFNNEIEKENAIKICGNKMETKGRVLKLWSFKQTRFFVESKLAIVNATNFGSHHSTEEDSDSSYIIDDKTLFELANSFQNSSIISRNISGGRIRFYPNTSKTTLKENMPSPERPGTRPSPATAFLLKQISEANMPEAGELYERIPRDNGNEKNRFLNLPAPYHLLPDTPYFRRAPIVPPPTRSLSATEQMPVQQRIINRYLASMKLDDENGFAAIAQYERESYDHLCASSQNPLTEEYRRDATAGTGEEKQLFSTDFLDDDRPKECNGTRGVTSDDWLELLISPKQHYEMWSCSPMWTWNLNLKE